MVTTWKNHGKHMEKPWFFGVFGGFHGGLWFLLFSQAAEERDVALYTRHWGATGQSAEHICIFLK